MAKSQASTPEQYVRELPDDRRETVSAVRDLVLRNLPPGYEESMSWGMLSYEIPLDRYPETYNGKPLGYVAIASHKSYITLYLMGAYAVPALAKKLEKAFADAGKKFDMGKSCLHFHTLDDLEVDVLAEVIGAVPVEKYIEHYESSRGKNAKSKAATAKKPAKKRAEKKGAAKKETAKRPDRKK